MTQAQMGELFATSTDNVGLHLKNIYAEGELHEEETTEDFSVVRRESKRQVRRQLRHYNLVALALLVTERLPEQKGLMIRLVEHFVLLKEQTIKK